MSITSNFSLLQNKIKSKEAKLCIIGLGYVGLPLALAFSRKGYLVYGLDNNISRIERLKNGERYILDFNPREALSLIQSGRFIPTSDSAVMSGCDVVIVCVPTPLRKVKMPDVSYIIDATTKIKANIRLPQLIVLESTSYPTTTRDVVLPILRKDGLEEGKDFFLCFSPERVNPGDKKFPLIKVPKVVGGISPQATELARALYSKIIKKVFCVSSAEAAETAKLLENTFRLVNIALINEFAIVCQKLGIDIWEVIEAAKTKPFGFMPFYPGPGLGGHCIPVDPLYLSWKAKTIGFKTKMIDLASYINRFMPMYVIERVQTLLQDKGIRLKDARVLIVGVTYKKDTKDIRESPALEIIEGFKKKKTKVDFYDPLIPYLKIDGIDLKGITLTRSNLKKYDCSIIIADHSNVNYEYIRKNSKLIFDTRNVYKHNKKGVIRL